ncbi:response regulator transcription factor [Bacillus tianshenii]|nr:response regulator transcription factor [Bacillus tianshenii]
MHLLVAEDDQRLAKLIVHMLKKENHSVDWVANGEDALFYIQSSGYDLVILDWMMPGLSGIQVCQKLRKENFTKPILLLTAKDAVEDRVYGLDAGADDYLVKPFEFEELFARIRALSRRGTQTIQEESIQCGQLSLNLTTKEVWKDGVFVQLTPKEYQLFELFMRHKNQVLPREVLIDRIWGFDAIVTNNSLDALVRLLRKKIEDADERCIQNIRGIGYKLVTPYVSQNS